MAAQSLDVICFNSRSVYCRSATASYVDAWLTSWQCGIPLRSAHHCR